MIRYGKVGIFLVCALFLVFISCRLSTSGDRTNGTPGGVGGTANGPDVPTGEEPTADEISLFSLINQLRLQAGMQPFHICLGLGDCARAHAKDMHERTFFSHVNPEGESATERGRAGHAGGNTFQQIVPNPYYGIQECISRNRLWIVDEEGAPTLDPVQATFEGWMANQADRDKLLGNTWNYAGVGNCGNDPICHWVLCLGVMGTGGGAAPGGGGKTSTEESEE